MNENLIASPGFGLPVRLTVTPAGDPVGPVTVAPLSGLTAASFIPKTVGGLSSEMLTCAPAAGGMTRRPSPFAPRSAWLRSVITCLKPALRAVAVHDVIERIGRRRIGGAAGEQIAVARRRIEQAENLVELRGGHTLRRGLAAGVDHRSGRCRGLHAAAEIGDARQRGLLQAGAHVDLRNGVRIAAHRGELRAQADREPAIGPEPRIGGRFLSRPELTLQIVELGAHVAERLHHQRGLDSNSGDVHLSLTSAAAG